MADDNTVQTLLCWLVLIQWWPYIADNYNIYNIYIFIRDTASTHWGPLPSSSKTFLSWHSLIAGTRLGSSCSHWTSISSISNTIGSRGRFTLAIYVILGLTWNLVNNNIYIIYSPGWWHTYLRYYIYILQDWAGNKTYIYICMFNIMYWNIYVYLFSLLYSFHGHMHQITENWSNLKITGSHLHNSSPNPINDSPIN